MHHITTVKEIHMKTSRLLLPLLLLSSMISAEKIQLNINVRVGEESQHLEKIVEFSEEVSVFMHEDEASKFELAKEDDHYAIKIYVKDDAQEWHLISNPFITLTEPNKAAVVSVGNDDSNFVEVVLTLIAD